MEVAAWFMVWGCATPLVSALSSSSASAATRRRGEKKAAKGPAVSTTIPHQRVVFGEPVHIDVPDLPPDEALERMESCLNGCRHGWFTSCYEGTKLHYRYWEVPDDDDDDEKNKNKTPPRAVVIFMHGIHTHSGKGYCNDDKEEEPRRYNMSLQSQVLVNQHRIACYAFDLYGHGYSAGRRFWISDYHHHVRDYVTFCEMVAAQHPGTPLFLMGESYGCTLTLHVAKHFQDAKRNNAAVVDSLILTAPAIVADVPPFPLFQILKVLARLFPTWRPFFMPNTLPPDRIWRDKEILRVRTTDPSYLCLDGSGRPFRLGTGLNLVRALEDVRTILPTLTVPFCILHGTEDHGVPMAGSELLFAQAPSADKRFLPKPGAFHDLLADPEVADECMQDIVDWIQHRLDVTTQN